MTDTEETDPLGPFAHEVEAAVCRRVLGDRAHGLDGLVEVSA
ncbi:hypothetical protein Acsp06_55990 [Actinomycetospora sp. NBRC 106375]|nr:hypothetical protein [Actinomycetospora sp. NBRC 106375]GLZ49414.1 hypothetical protein Acsp06_55990 [Actinomycetospora sp. NBRC 106375]